MIETRRLETVVSFIQIHKSNINNALVSLYLTLKHAAHWPNVFIVNFENAFIRGVFKTLFSISDGWLLQKYLTVNYAVNYFAESSIWGLWQSSEYASIFVLVGWVV